MSAPIAFHTALPLVAKDPPARHAHRSSCRSVPRNTPLAAATTPRHTDLPKVAGAALGQDRFSDKIKLPNPYASEPIPESARAEVDALLASGDLFRYTASSDAPAFLLETEFAAWLGSKYALAVSSCSAALFLSLRSLNLPKDARVIIPAFTFAAVPSAVIHANCVPVLCEVGMDYRIDLTHFSRLVDEQDIDAVMISHMRGHTSDMDVIGAICDARGIPLIEDAAHSLGTTWNGRNLGTLGAMGCFSFQSYKMLNGGEGGMLVSDDPDLMAQAVIMSGAYEHMWKKHDVLHQSFAKWQNQLPVYNLRISNLSAAVIRPQLNEIERRVRDGRANHDYLAAALNSSKYAYVPPSLGPELRAPDSIQFNVPNLTAEQRTAFVALAQQAGVHVSIFGVAKDNARAFWNWQFLPEQVELRQTRSMLMLACDLRLPPTLSFSEIDVMASKLLNALEEAAA